MVRTRCVLPASQREINAVGVASESDSIPTANAGVECAMMHSTPVDRLHRRASMPASTPFLHSSALRDVDAPLPSQSNSAAICAGIAFCPRAQHSCRASKLCITSSPTPLMLAPTLTGSGSGVRVWSAASASPVTGPEPEPGTGTGPASSLPAFISVGSMASLAQQPAPNIAADPTRPECLSQMPPLLTCVSR